MLIELKSCPFCAGTAKFARNNMMIKGVSRKCAWVYCPTCEARTNYYLRDFDEHYCRSAIEAWNMRPMQKPMTLEELKTEPCDSYVWEERRTDLNIYFERTSALVLAFMCVNSKEDMYKYGSSVRAWKKMPTDEEMEAAAWES